MDAPSHRLEAHPPRASTNCIKRHISHGASVSSDTDDAVRLLATPVDDRLARWPVDGVGTAVLSCIPRYLAAYVKSLRCLRSGPDQLAGDDMRFAKSHVARRQFVTATGEIVARRQFVTATTGRRTSRAASS